MNSLVTFNFKDNQIRTQTVDNEPYFCLRDVCLALGLKNSKDRDFNKGVETFYLPTKSGNQNITFINEPNLYRLIFRSNKPQAQAFADWVYSEVLPSIRKTGAYGVPAIDAKTIGGIVKRCAASAIREELQNLLVGCANREHWELSDQDLIYNLYRWHCSRSKEDTIAFRQLSAKYEALLLENKGLKENALQIKQLASQVQL